MRYYIKNENGDILGCEFAGTPFSIAIENIKSEVNGVWNTKNVVVYKDGVSIGGYERNYNSQGMAADTFYPFQYNNDWYALYSKDYTATRVAKLTDTFEDWCGEERHTNGFCPTEFYVPRSNVFEMQQPETGWKFAYRTFDNEYSSKEKLMAEFYGREMDADGFREELHISRFIKQEYLSLGFLSGCVWGDDSSWKLRFIDLSKLDQKILTITEKFGYWELPELQQLHECVKIDAWYEDPTKAWIKLTGTQSFSLYNDKFEKEI